MNIGPLKIHSAHYYMCDNKSIWETVYLNFFLFVTFFFTTPNSYHQGHKYRPWIRFWGQNFKIRTFSTTFPSPKNSSKMSLLTYFFERFSIYFVYIRWCKFVELFVFYKMHSQTPLEYYYIARYRSLKIALFEKNSIL